MVYLIPRVAITNWVFKRTVIYSLTELFQPCYPWADTVNVSDFRHSNSISLLARRLEIQNQNFGLLAGPCSLLKALPENLSNASLLVSGIANNSWLASNFLAHKPITHVSPSVFTRHSPCRLLCIFSCRLLRILVMLD